MLIVMIHESVNYRLMKHSRQPASTDNPEPDHRQARTGYYWPAASPASGSVTDMRQINFTQTGHLHDGLKAQAMV